MFSVKAQDGKPVVRSSVHEDESGGIVNRDGCFWVNEVYDSIGRRIARGKIMTEKQS